MKKISLTLFFSIIVSTLLYGQSPKPEVFYVTLDENTPVTADPVRKYEGGQAPQQRQQPSTMELFPEFTYQTIAGMGGCFNEIGAVALMSLPEAARDEVMRNLFSSDAAAFSFCRTAIGSSDFGVSAYSYSEVNGDYGMKDFSMAREENSVIPYIQTAFKYNPGMKLFASPWSPPGWMKESGRMEGLVDNNRLRDDPRIYQAYALYFSKYIEEYAKRGIKVDRICVQNETDCNVKYPSCVFPPEQMIKFINGYLAPEFARKNVSAEIWGGTYRVIEGSTSYEAMTLFADPGIRKNVKGVGVQYQKFSNLADFRMYYPDVPMMHTESICHGGQNSIDQAYDRLSEIAQYITAGAENFAYWNMILDETGESGWDWKQNSLINIDRNNGKVTYNPDYAVMYLVSKFVRPGDQRIAHIFRGPSTFAVKDDAGKSKFFTINKNDQPAAVVVKIQGREDATVTVPPRSFAVIVY